MDIILLVAKVMGIYLCVSGLVLVFKGQTLTQLLKDFFDHPAVVYLTGIILIFLSSIYLLQYNIWEGTRETIVTIFVWLVGIKGLMYIFFPEMLNKWTERKFRGPLVVYGIVAIIIGLYLFFLK